MANRLRRALTSVAAGAVFLASIWVLHHGVGETVLGSAQEPQESFAPLRWQNLPTERPVRVLLLGTSLTARGSWSAALQQELSECRPGGVEVERLARPGANSAWGQEALAQRLQAGPTPDLLVVEFSINDSSLWRGMTLGKSEERHRAILTLAQQAGVPVWLSTMSPAFGIKAAQRPGQVAYRALYQDLARAEGAGLIAIAPSWRALTAEARSAAMPDHLHPVDAAMQEITVPALVAALSPVLCPAP